MQQIIEATKHAVAAHRSTWQVWHVRSEAERQARHQAPAGANVDALVDYVVAAVLNPTHSIPLGKADPVQVPDVLRRRDGASVYEVAGSRLYTSAAVLADEAYLVEAAARRGGRAATDVDVDVALLESVANGVTLNTAQAHLVRTDGHLRGPGAAGDRPGRLRQDHRHERPDPGLDRLRRHRPRAGPLRGRRLRPGPADRRPRRHPGQAGPRASRPRRSCPTGQRASTSGPC